MEQPRFSRITLYSALVLLVASAGALVTDDGARAGSAAPMTVSAPSTIPPSGGR